jgi:hypothetical protein
VTTYPNRTYSAAWRAASLRALSEAGRGRLGTLLVVRGRRMSSEAEDRERRDAVAEAERILDGRLSGRQPVRSPARPGQAQPDGRSGARAVPGAAVPLDHA